MRLVNWNINGIRASIKKDLFSKLTDLNVDIIALQEVKCQDEDMENIFKKNNQTSEASLFDVETTNSSNFTSRYKAFWHTAKSRKGYSGTCILVKNHLVKYIQEEFYLLDDEEFNTEGRITGLKLEINNQKILVVNGYYPQGGREGRVMFKVRFYNELYNKLNQFVSEGYCLILCGDFNTTIKDQDLARPKENKKTTGCLPQERVALNWFIETSFFDLELLKITDTDFLGFQSKPLPSLNLIDAFRHFKPNESGHYTYWDQITRARERNVGWRIDYWLVDKKLIDKVKNCEILSSVMGSDHCPVLLEIEI